MRRLETIQSLSPLQEGLLFHAAAGGGAGAYLVQFVLTLEDIDPPCLRQALAEAVAAHPALRSGFSWETVRKPVAVVMSGVGAPWVEEDWSGRGADCLEAYLEADRARGFELTRPPLIRALLAREGEGLWRFVLSYHHLLMDGWSAALLFDELGERYAALSEGREPRLQPRRPYADFLAWLEARDLAGAERYWRGQLAHAPATGAPLSAPAKPGQRTGRIVERRARVEAGPWAKACSLARRLGVTPAVVAAGAWALTLSRAHGEADVLFGATIAGRPPELEGSDRMIGLFINTVPIRARAFEHLGLGDFLQGLQQTMQEAREHGHAPLARILGWAAPERASFETLFVYENYPPAAASVRGRLGVKAAESREESSFPAALVLEPQPDGGLEACLSHDEARLGGQGAALLLERYVRLIAAMAEAGADTPIGLIDHRTGRDIAVAAALRAEANDQPCPPLLPRLFLDQAASTPEHPALVWRGQSISYAALAARACAIAAAIVRRAPGPNPVVAIAMEREPDLVAAMLGAMLAGGAYLPLDPGQPSARIRHICEAAGAGMLICHQATSGIDPGLPKLLVDEALEPAAGFAAAAVRPDTLAPDTLAYVIATSGSTGAPKPVAITHRALASFVEWGRRAYPAEALARVAFATPVTFDVSVFEVFVPLASGGTAILFEDIVDLDTDGAAGPSLVCGVPSLIGSFEAPASCAYMNLAGEALPQSLADRLTSTGPSNAGGRTVRNLYGPTEGTVYATMAELRHGEPVTIGRPLPHVSAYVLSPALRPVGVGEAGELYLSGPTLASGYLGMPGLTARAFLPDPFGPPGGRMYRTGDLVRIEPDGRLVFLGRRDSQVKLRGLRIELGEVEAALYAAGLGVDEAAAVIVPGAAGRARLVACVTRPVDRSALEAVFAQRLPAAFRPQGVVQIEALPLTRSGKLDRKALAAAVSRRSGQMSAGDADFRDETERVIAAAVAGALGVDHIGPEDDFFALGGDSIISLQAAAMARKAGVRVGPDQIVRLRTPRAMAAALGESAIARPVTGSATQAFPLGPIQRRFFEEGRSNPDHFNQAILLSTAPDIDRGALTAAISAVQSRHPALGFRFRQGEGGWRQSPSETIEPLRLADLSRLPKAEQADRIAAECARVQQGLDIVRGPVFAAVHMDLGEGREGRLLLAAHHLCVDGVSWRIILDDIAGAYASSRAGKAIALEPEPAPFSAWVEAARRFAQAPEREADWNRWLALAKAPATRLPCDGSGEPRTGAERTVQRALDPETTARLLRDAPRRQGTTITAVLLGALGHVLARWCGGPLVVDLEGHGRHDLGSGLDLGRTVGWFTSLFPVRLDIDPGTGPSGAVSEAARALGDPAAGASYGLLRYLSGDPRAERLKAVKGQVLFNYLGQLDSIVAGAPISDWAPEPVGADEASGEARSHLIEINARTTGGELVFAWRFSPGRHDDATIGRLADLNLEALRSLALPEGMTTGGAVFGVSEASRTKVLARLQPKL